MVTTMIPPNALEPDVKKSEASHDCVDSPGPNLHGDYDDTAERSR